MEGGVYSGDDDQQSGGSEGKVLTVESTFFMGDQ